MKKLILSIVVASTFVSAAIAQNVNAQSFKDKVAKAKAATQDPKKGVKAASWISLGDAYVAMANAYTADVYVGLAEVEVATILGKLEGDGVPIVTINGADYKHYAYPQVDLYFNEKGALEYFLAKEAIDDSAFELAFAAYNKALEVDSKSASKVKDALEKLVMATRAEGANAYSLGQFALASKDFAVASKVASTPTVNAAEAGELLFYAAVTALQAEQFQAGVDALLVLKEKGDHYDGDVFNYLAMCYTGLGQNDKVEPILIEGLEKYQANQGVLHSLISYYISADEDPNKVIPYIKKAQEDSPNDPNLLIAEGLAYESMKDNKKAMEAYGKALAIKADFFDAAYNYALATYRMAGEVIKELGSIDLSNQSEFDQKEVEAVDLFKQAVERMEVAHAIMPNSRDAVEVLKSIYFRLSGNRLTKDDPSYKVNYDKYKALLDSM